MSLQSLARAGAGHRRPVLTAKLNDIDPQAWLADVLARIADHTIQDLDQLLPWNWKLNATKLAA
jgi:transposase